jgi:hypothetical protein
MNQGERNGFRGVFRHAMEIKSCLVLRVLLMPMQRRCLFWAIQEHSKANTWTMRVPRETQRGPVLVFQHCRMAEQRMHASQLPQVNIHPR